MPTRTTATSKIFYPDSDGKPVGESDLHRDEILFTIGAQGGRGWRCRA